jgi:hypothetical protein
MTGWGREQTCSKSLHSNTSRVIKRDQRRSDRLLGLMEPIFSRVSAGLLQLLNREFVFVRLDQIDLQEVSETVDRQAKERTRP